MSTEDKVTSPSAAQQRPKTAQDNIATTRKRKKKHRQSRRVRSVIFSEFSDDEDEEGDPSDDRHPYGHLSIVKWMQDTRRRVEEEKEKKEKKEEKEEPRETMLAYQRRKNDELLKSIERQKWEWEFQQWQRIGRPGKCTIL